MENSRNSSKGSVNMYQFNLTEEGFVRASVGRVWKFLLHLDSKGNGQSVFSASEFSGNFLGGGSIAPIFSGGCALGR